MKVFNRLNVITSSGKLVHVDESTIPDENSWDSDNTWYGFEHNIRLTKNANFKWYENCYADLKSGVSGKLLSFLERHCKQWAKPQEYKKGHDYYKILYFTLADDPKFAYGDINFALAICCGGSRDTFWTGEFLVIQPQHLDQVMKFLYRKGF